MAMEADVKNMYAKNVNRTQIAGLDGRFDEPVNCDLMIEVDNESAEESFRKIVEYIEERTKNETQG